MYNSLIFFLISQPPFYIYLTVHGEAFFIKCETVIFLKAICRIFNKTLVCRRVVYSCAVRLIDHQRATLCWVSPAPLTGPLHAAFRCHLELAYTKTEYYSIYIFIPMYSWQILWQVKKGLLEYLMFLYL